MYDPPGPVWALVLAGVIGVPATTCAALYSGGIRAGLGARRAGLLAGGAAAVFGGWVSASAVIAALGWYRAGPGQVPWNAVAMIGFLGVLLGLRRIPVVARVLAGAGMVRRLTLPHSFRVVGVFFLLYMFLGRLPALFALPAGLGDITAGIAALLVARRLAVGTGRRAALWFNAFGLADLAVSITIGALSTFQLLDVVPSVTPIGELPLALILTTTVPLFIFLHVTSVSALVTASPGRQRAVLA